MTIDHIASDIYAIRNDDYRLFQSDVENVGNILFSELSLQIDKKEYIAKINGIKKGKRHLAFLYSIILEKIFPNDQEIILLCSNLALNINYSEYSINALYSLILNIDKSHLLYTNTITLLAKSYRNAGNFDEAIKYFKLAQSTFAEKSDIINEGWQIYSIGKMYLNYLQQPSRSIDLLLQAKQKFESADDKTKYRGISACLDELGDVYRQGLKDYNKAIEIYNEAILFNEQKEHYYLAGLSRNYCHLGICYKNLNNLEAAEDYLKKGIDILRGILGQEKGLGIRLTQLGNIQIERGQIDEGYENLIIGQKYNSLYNNSEYTIQNDIYQGDYYFNSNEIDLAIIKYQEAIELSRNTYFYALSSIAFKKLSDCYFKLRLFNESKLAIKESVNSNIKHWSNVKNGTPIAIKISQKAELGEMYQSLFFKLYDDYNINFKNTISNLDNVYDTLILEYNQQRKSFENVLRFGNIMSGIKHEIQNLHNNIVVVIDDIVDENGVTEENITLLKHLRSKILEKSQVLSNTNLKEIISNIGVPFKLTKLILNDLLFKIVSDFRLSNINFEKNIADISCNLSLDEISLKYILLNILLNSKEAFEMNNITINERKIKINSEIIDNELLINVVDNAGGIPIENMNKIYEFGFTTKLGSTGYGLPSVLALINSCNGNIDIRTVSSGVNITIKMPLI